MGVYLNPGNSGFTEILSGIYVDKTGLITNINEVIGTTRKLVCVSRPRRFGKSFAAQMLCAYYDKSCDSHPLFDNLSVSADPTYEKYINCFDVIYLDMTTFRSKDDVLTLLIHLGYLAYNAEKGTARIPNEEIRIEFQRSIHEVKHSETMKRVEES